MQKIIEDRLNLFKYLVSGELRHKEIPVHVVNEQFMINLFHIAAKFRNDNFAGRAIELAYQFSKFEQKYVFSHNRSYEDFREIYGLDWDEVLDDLIDWDSCHKTKWTFNANRIKKKKSKEIQGNQ